jgi:hypothetical protein
MTPDGRRAHVDAPADVRVTVTTGPRGERPGSRTAFSAALLIALLGAIAAGVSLADRGGGARTAGDPRAAAPAVAAAFGYPLRCLTVTIYPSDPSYARAHVDPSRGCERYGGYVNASFHLVRGTWRLVLDEGQLFVPNRLLVGCRVSTTDCCSPNQCVAPTHR